MAHLSHPLVSVPEAWEDEEMEQLMYCSICLREISWVWGHPPAVCRCDEYEVDLRYSAVLDEIDQSRAELEALSG